MRLNKALTQSGLSALFALMLILTFSEHSEARGKNRHRDRQQRHERQCEDYLSRNQRQAFFENSHDNDSSYSDSHYQSQYQDRSEHQYRSNSKRNRNSNRNRERNEQRRHGQRNDYRGTDHFRDQPVEGLSSTAAFGDIRDKIYEEVAGKHKRSLSYGDARERIMHELDMRQDQRGTYVWDYYCQRAYRISPNEMPSSNELNIEHTWPQSRFSTRFPKDVQKSDMHHLFPTDSWANQLRENMNFGYVVRDTRHTDANCKESRVGYDKNNQMRFQPPTHHRGSVARALFYFSVRYKIALDKEHEAILRQWHKDDPVSADEIERNNKIEKIQGNRNPFIDNPALVDDVPTFQ